MSPFFTIYDYYIKMRKKTSQNWKNTRIERASHPKHETTPESESTPSITSGRDDAERAAICRRRQFDGNRPARVGAQPTPQQSAPADTGATRRQIACETGPRDGRDHQKT